MNYSGKPAMTKNPFIYSLILVPVLVLFASATGYAQKKSKNPNAIDTAAIMRDETMTVENKLVALALAGPQIMGSDAQNKVNEYQLKKAQQSWLNLLSVSSSYNFSNQLNKGDNNGNVYVAPGLNLGVTIPFGIIFSKGTDVKIRRESLKQSQFNLDVAARNLKAEVLSKYLEYKNYRELILMQSKVVDDEQAALKQVENKFREGGTSIEVYNNATKIYNNEVAKKLNLQLSQDQTRLQIEALIGVSLDEVIAKSKSSK